MLIDKSEFVDIMKALESANNLQKQINDLMRTAKDNIENDFMNGASLMICHEGIVLELLKKIFQDSEDWISWWCYETDYAKRKDMTHVTDDLGNEWWLKTAEDLYDFLIEEYNL